MKSLKEKIKLKIDSIEKINPFNEGVEIGLNISYNYLKHAIKDYLYIIKFLDNKFYTEKYLELCLKYNIYISAHKYTEKDVFLQIFGDKE